LKNIDVVRGIVVLFCAVSAAFPDVKIAKTSKQTNKQTRNKTKQNTKR
jgi:uncharacterized membrane protein